MHGTALTPAVTVYFSEQFGEHTSHVSALGETMAMPAVRAGDIVARAQGGAHPDCDCFLTYGNMQDTGYQSAGIEVLRLLLKFPDHQHLTVKMEQLFLIETR